MLPIFAKTPVMRVLSVRPGWGRIARVRLMMRRMLSWRVVRVRACYLGGIRRTVAFPMRRGVTVSTPLRARTQLLRCGSVVSIG